MWALCQKVYTPGAGKILLYIPLKEAILLSISGI
jgi:hypothetical protein